MYWDLAFANFGYAIVLEFSDAETVNRPSYMIIYFFFFLHVNELKEVGVDLRDVTPIRPPILRKENHMESFNIQNGRSDNARHFNRLPAIIVLVDEHPLCVCVFFYLFL